VPGEQYKAVPPLPNPASPLDLERETKLLSIRAHEIHGALRHQIERDRRTTAVLSTDKGWIAGGGNQHDLTKGQESLLGGGEYPARLPNEDAEKTVLVEALKRGFRPRAIAATRPICPDCADFIRWLGGHLTSSTTAIFPE
jgi:hypothetical protein